MLYVLLTLLFLSPKETKWFEVSSDHFVLFTDTSEMKGRRLLSDFENRVDAFSQAFGKVPPRQLPIEVFLFKEEQDFLEALPRIKTDPNVVTVQQTVQPRIPGLPIPGLPGPQRTPTGNPGGIPERIPGGNPGTPPGQGPQFPQRPPGEDQLR